MTHALDASAIIAYLRGEPGHERLRTLIENPANRLVVHAVNLGEVRYGVLRHLGAEAADLAVRLTLDFARERRHLGRRFMAKVASWKAGHRISYADAFALALAEVERVPLVTTDHHEFDPIEQAGTAKFYWLR